MTLGAELRKARLAAKKTQEQVASVAKIDRPYLSLLEHDKKSPTVDMLIRICSAIGIRASVVLARTEKLE